MGKTASLSLGWSLESHWVEGESQFSLAALLARCEGGVCTPGCWCVIDRCLCVVLEHPPSVIGVSCIQTPNTPWVSKCSLYT